MTRANSLVEISLAPDPVIEAYKRDIDRTLLRERLKRSVEDRLRALYRLRDVTRLQAMAEELRRAGRKTFG